MSYIEKNRYCLCSPEDAEVDSNEFSTIESDANIDNEKGQSYNPEETG